MNAENSLMETATTGLSQLSSVWI